MLKNSVLECVGNTYLVRLESIEKEFNLSYKLYAKLERMNPSGSVKDRAVLEIINDALKKGEINKDTVILEATSGNTGISIGMISAKLGLKSVLIMPENVSKERVKIMKAFGSEVILTSKKFGMKGTIDKLNELKDQYPNHFEVNQFNNENNALAHELHTAKEILDDLDGKVDVFISAFGTSGTLIGTSRGLKKVNKNIEVIGVEPFSSPLITKGTAGKHKIQGIGANFVPGIYDSKWVDRVIDIKNKEAYEGARLLARKEGLFVGISSGASLMAALKLDNGKYKDKNVVFILPDNGERYLSVNGLFNK